MSDEIHTNEPELTPEQEAALEEELNQFAADEATKLGVAERSQYVEHVASEFWAEQRGHTTLLISGLSVASDTMVEAALAGLGYKAGTIPTPDRESLRYGKEFGNRGQCSPTYFTVGNLVKYLVHLRDVEGIPTQDIIENNIFMTAGGCGPCRFGMYVTEYRKALRDAGFDGFRVLTFQMAGGIRQATGKELGFRVDPAFAWHIVRALIVGDILNILGYRMRPYEVVAGSTDDALERCKALLFDTFARKGHISLALMKCRRILSKVEIDRTTPKPMVSIIGEFFAMTTEGDGNYHMHRFLEGEGAEVEIQGITNWLLFLLWEASHDTERRQELRYDDMAKKGLSGKDATKKLWSLKGGDMAVRSIFQIYANILGLHNYELPDMHHIAKLAEQHYSTEVRGGEGHMEVGKLIHFVEDRVNHLTVSVKPFGCMPSSGVSDGVQSLVQAKYPESLFIPIETTGDQEVNAHSRVQMVLFKAKQKSRAEFEKALEETGMTVDEFKARVKKSRWWSAPFTRPKHKVASVVTNLVYAVG
jgi:predicted nucleotide-binding protein (sugar kinase/HSP70/actin superfamily)